MRYFHTLVWDIKIIFTFLQVRISNTALTLNGQNEAHEPLKVRLLINFSHIDLLNTEMVLQRKLKRKKKSFFLKFAGLNFERFIQHVTAETYQYYNFMC